MKTWKYCTLTLFYAAIAVVIAFALIACSGKNNSRQAETAGLVMELEAIQTVQQITEVETSEAVTSAPGYFMYCAGSGGSYYFMTLDDGKIWAEWAYKAENGDAAWLATPMFWAIVRSF